MGFCFLGFFFVFANQSLGKSLGPSHTYNGERVILRLKWDRRTSELGFPLKWPRWGGFGSSTKKVKFSQVDDLEHNGNFSSGTATRAYVLGTHLNICALGTSFTLWREAQKASQVRKRHNDQRWPKSLSTYECNNMYLYKCVQIWYFSIIIWSFGISGKGLTIFISQMALTVRRWF